LPGLEHRADDERPSVWWDDEVILRMVDELAEKLPLKIWLDTGTAEPG